MVRHFEFSILNVSITMDHPREFTLMIGSNDSTIDYFIVSSILLPKALNLQVSLWDGDGICKISFITLQILVQTELAKLQY